MGSKKSVKGKLASALTPTLPLRAQVIARSSFTGSFRPHRQADRFRLADGNEWRRFGFTLLKKIVESAVAANRFKWKV